MKKFYNLLKQIKTETNAIDVDIVLSTEGVSVGNDVIEKEYLYIVISLFINGQPKSLSHEICCVDDIDNISIDNVVKSVKFDIEALGFGFDGDDLEGVVH